MTRCASLEELGRWLGDELDAEQRHAIGRHVDECASCQLALDRLLSKDETALPAVGSTPLEIQASLQALIVDLQAMPPVARPSVPGYEILGLLGRGGMGVVYKARQVALRRIVALKMVLARGEVGPRELARFRTEAEAVAQIQHPHIIQIHEVGETGGLPYCVLEFVDGGTLAEKLRVSPLPIDEAATLVETLARAMQAAHERHIVHRDLKPANILLTQSGIPKITDFGLARRLDLDSGATQSGTLLGTPSYMAPEQAEGAAHEAGPAADVYALGAILYACVTGQPPFRGRSIAETLVLVRSADPLPLSRVRPKVPRDLETICLKAMAKEPNRRYATADELADDLHRFLKDEPIRARRVGWTERLWRRARRNPLVTGLVALVGTLAFVLGLVFTRPWTTSRDPAPTRSAHNSTDHDTSADDLLALVAELDRTDPGWRFEQLQGARVPIPSERNGALQILAFRNQVAEFLGRPASEGAWLDPKLIERYEACSTLPPAEPFSSADLADFQAELNRVDPLLAQAHRMIDFPEGQFPLAVPRDVVSFLMPHVQAARRMSELLDLEARVQWQFGNPSVAATNGRAMFHCASAFDGEPIAVSQVVRAVILCKAVAMLELQLTRDSALSDDDLAWYRRRLELEIDYPMHVIMARGDRAAKHYFLGSLETGDAAFDLLSPLGLQDRSDLPGPRELRQLHISQLRFSTRWVEIAKLPLEQWCDALAQLEQETNRQVSRKDPSGKKLREFILSNPSPLLPLRHASVTRTALVGIALEQHRRAHGAWPNSLDELVPVYLAQVPNDPYDHQPLRYRRTDDGVLVYSVGPDRTDDRGRLSRQFEPPTGSDLGFQRTMSDGRAPR